VRRDVAAVLGEAVPFAHQERARDRLSQADEEERDAEKNQRHDVADPSRSRPAPTPGQRAVHRRRRENRRQQQGDDAARPGVSGDHPHQAGEGYEGAGAPDHDGGALDHALGEHPSWLGRLRHPRGILA